jgi:hypothetical protein
MKDPNVEKNLNPQLAPAPEREFATRWVCPNQHARIFVGVRQVFPVSIKIKVLRVLHRGAAATVPGEDCLRLNLWTPEVDASDKRPVMVYMHGGRQKSGGASAVAERHCNWYEIYYRL